MVMKESSLNSLETTSLSSILQDQGQLAVKLDFLDLKLEKEILSNSNGMSIRVSCLNSLKTASLSSSLQDQPRAAAPYCLTSRLETEKH